MKTAKVLFLSLALGALSASAFAQAEKPAGKGDQPQGDRPPRGQGRQGGMGGQPMSAEASAAAWTMQANGVSKRLALTEDQTKTVATAYTTARKEFQAKFDEARKGTREEMTENFKKLNEAAKASSEKFTKTLNDAKIPAEAVTKASASLGTISMAVSPNWDRIVNVVSEFKLDAAKQQTVLNAVEDYAVAGNKSRASMEGGKGDPEATRSAMQESRKTLIAAVKGSLTAEQLTKFENSMGGAGGGRGGAPRGEHPDGDKPKGK